MDTVAWLFGRGLSIGCGLSWNIPTGLTDLPRGEKIRQIKADLLDAMGESCVDLSLIRQLLGLLSQNQTRRRQHLFVTTNWDFLLQKEIDNLPDTSWLIEGFVHHLNGCVDPSTNGYRSPFLLPEDSAFERPWTVEANTAFNYLLTARLFVVVGVSFECATDRALLHALGASRGNLPIGESDWIVIDPNRETLDRSCSRIQGVLPNARFLMEPCTFSEWVDKSGPAFVDLTRSI